MYSSLKTRIASVESEITDVMDGITNILRELWAIKSHFMRDATV